MLLYMHMLQYIPGHSACKTSPSIEEVVSPPGPSARKTWAKTLIQFCHRWRAWSTERVSVIGGGMAGELVRGLEREREREREGGREGGKEGGREEGRKDRGEREGERVCEGGWFGNNWWKWGTMVHRIPLCRYYSWHMWYYK